MKIQYVQRNNKISILWNIYKRISNTYQFIITSYPFIKNINTDMYQIYYPGFPGTTEKTLSFRKISKVFDVLTRRKTKR